MGKGLKSLSESRQTASWPSQNMRGWEACKTLTPSSWASLSPLGGCIETVFLLLPRIWGANGTFYPIPLRMEIQNRKPVNCSLELTPWQQGAYNSCCNCPALFVSVSSFLVWGTRITGSWLILLAVYISNKLITLIMANCIFTSRISQVLVLVLPYLVLYM